MLRAAVRVEGHHADPGALGTVLTHKAVRVRPVRDVFGHQGDGHRHLLHLLQGALDLRDRQAGRQTGRQTDRQRDK